MFTSTTEFVRLSDVRGKSERGAMIVFRLSKLGEKLQSARTLLARSLRFGTRRKTVQILPGVVAPPLPSLSV